MKLEQTTYDNSETDCCVRLDSEVWDGRVLEWQDSAKQVVILAKVG